MTRSLSLAVALLLSACPLTMADVPRNPGPRPEAIHAVMWRISRQEGFYVCGTIPATHNNPGALVFCRQAGAVAGDRGELAGKLRFARFRTEAAGWAALERDIRLKQRRGVPLSVAWRYLPY